MSNNDIQRADQIAFHFYTKLFYVVNEARATAETKGAAKMDKWFNLETSDSDLFTREQKEPFKSISLFPPSGPPSLEIEVLLTVPELTHNQALVYLAPDSSRVRIEPTPRFVLLESWVLSFVPHDQDVDVALPTIYKHGIPLFRSLFSLLRVLPAWKLYKRLKRRTGGVVRNGHLGIQLRVRPSSSSDSDTDNSILRFHTPPSPSIHEPLPVQTQSFPGVPHPLGSLSLSTTYLSTANFQLDELESLLSSRFISLDLDGGDGFVPTLTKNAQRDSLTGSSLPASSGIRSTLARSPPKPIPRPGGGGSDSLSVAERFILPSRTASLGSGSSGSRVPPPSRPSTSNSNFTQTTAAQLGSMTAANPLSGLAVSRLRRESLNSSPSSSLHRDLPSAPFPMNMNPGTSSLSSSPSSGPLPIRRPNINPVHPFKSNTLSSASGSSPSLSIRQAPFASGSPLSNPGGGGVPSSSLARQHQPSGSTSSTSRIPPSPVGGGFPFASNRPSPPTFAPSSLGDRRPGTSGSGGSGERDRRVSMTDGGGGATEEGSRPMPSRKRYSSSFGHRYVGSVGSTGSGAGVIIAGAGSTGSGGDVAAGSAGSGGGGGLGERRERKESAVNSFLSTNTDDDDISHFVQDIDSRKPLSGRDKERQKRDRQRSESSESRSDSKGEESSRGQRHDRDTISDTTIRAKGKEREVPSLRAGTVFPSGGTATTSPVALASSPPPSQRTSSLSSATALVNPPITTRQLSTSPTAAQMSTSPNRGPMLTNQGEVEERLRKMNEAFLKSLEGISGGAGGSVRRKERERERTRVQRGESTGAGSGEDVHSRRGSEGGGLGSRGDSSPMGEGNSRGSPSPFAPEMRLRLGDRRQGSTSSLGNSTGASQGSQEVVGRMDFDDDSRRQSRY